MSGQAPVDANIPIETTDPVNSGQAGTDVRDENFWIELTTSNFLTAKRYQDAGLVDQWERNADHFNSKHPRRSAYNSMLYQGRSKLFRPISRASERAASSQAAQALFSNVELVDIKPKNINDDFQLASARIMKNILHDRLRNSIPWYLTVMGAFQDTRVYGPCITYTDWDYQYEEIDEKVPETSVHGKVIEGRTKTIKKKVVKTNKPIIEMLPPETVLFDPACDWRDPINSSPYVQRLVPMYVEGIESRMDMIHPKTGAPVWKRYPRAEILSAKLDSFSSVAQARDGDDKPDKTDAQERDEFKLIWCIQNFVRIDGVDHMYWTVGSTLLLTKPEPVATAVIAGVRPITYGFSVIETHKPSPSSATELIAQVQAAVNDIANLRIDNVRLALNKRYIIRRGAVVDLEALMRSVPGGGIMTENIDQDIKVVETRDVTASSYKEQERLDTEADDISGAFRGGSIQNNKSLNQTVGGMEMLNEGSNAISEMDIRTFTETWMKPQLKLLMLFIRACEEDTVIFNNAFEKSMEGFSFIKDLGEGADIEEIKDRLYKMVHEDEMTLDVNVGLGATNPQRKADTLSRTIQSIAQTEEQMKTINWDEVSKEQFAINGFQDGSRFIKSEEDGQEITEEDLQAAQEQGAEMAKDQMKQAEIEMRERVEMAKIQNESEQKQLDRDHDMQKHKESLQMKIQFEEIKDKTRRDEAAIRETNKANEIELKKTTGKSGI